MVPTFLIRHREMARPALGVVPGAMNFYSTQTDAIFIDILKTNNVNENFSPYRAENTLGLV